MEYNYINVKLNLGDKSEAIGYNEYLETSKVQTYK